MKMHELLVLREGVLALAAKELPVRVAYSVSKIRTRIDEEWRRHEELRRELVRKHGEPDPKNKRGIRVREDAMDAYLAEANELLMVDIEWDPPRILTTEVMEELDKRGVAIAPDALVHLARVIAEGAL